MRVTKQALISFVFLATGCNSHSGGTLPASQASASPLPAMQPKPLPAQIDQRSVQAIGMYGLFADMSCEIASKRRELLEKGGNPPSGDDPSDVSNYKEAAGALADFPAALEKLKALRAAELRCDEDGSPTSIREFAEAKSELQAEVELIQPTKAKQSLSEKKASEKAALKAVDAAEAAARAAEAAAGR